MMSRLTIACALACSLGSCTLANLDGFELPHCGNEAAARSEFDDGDHLCAAALNEENGYGSPDTCRPFRCIDRNGACVLSPVERCDGKDNDCDGLVDEDVQDLFDPVAVIDADGFARTEHTGDDLASVSVAPGLTDVTVTYTDIEDDAWSFVLGPGSRAADLRYGRNDVNQPWPRTTEMLVPDSCWRQSFPGAGSGLGGAPTFAPTTCSFAAIAADRVQGVGLVAAINTRAGCVDGQLRVGHTTGEEPDIFQVNGPWERSNSFLGVGLASDGRCTATQTAECQAAVEGTQDSPCDPECAAGEYCDGTSCVGTSACTTDGECSGDGRCLCGSCVSAAAYDRAQFCGVSDLAIAGTTPMGDQASGVIAFTSGSRQFHCGNFERDVAIIGASIIDSAGATSLDFVTTTNEGVPQVLGQTRAASAPAVYGLEDQYVVAYPTPSSDALAIHVVDGFPELVADGPDFTTATCLGDVAGETVSCTGPEAVCGLTDCGSDVGACVSGVRTCFRGEGICDGYVAGTDEVCANGVDEDCDGVIDENTAGRPCLADCVPVSETCNARDDDCDGMVDEDTEGAACDTPPGTATADSACVAGTEICRGGKLLCMGSVVPARDATTNGIEYTASDAPAGFPYGAGIDDDCDGTIDEAGTNNVTSCVGDGTREFCNGRDDDGDCIIDEDGTLQAADFIDTPEEERPREVVRQCIAEPAFPDLPATVVEGGLGFGLMDDLTIAGTTFARGNEIAIGIAWRETDESNPTSSRIGFRILRFQTECTCLMPGTKAIPNPDPCTCNPDTPDPECPCTISVPVECSESICSESTIGQIEFVGATDPVEVTTNPSNYGPPHVSYAPTGVIVAGNERSGRTVTRDGGFVVTYSEPVAGMDMVFRDAAMVRFFAEHDGLPRDPSCDVAYDECAAAREMDPTLPACEGCSANITVTGVDGEMRGIPDIDFPRSYFDPQAQETRYLYFDSRNSEFVSYPYACRDDEGE